MVTSAEIQDERERRQQEAEELRNQKESEKLAPPGQKMTVIGGNPDFELGSGVFSVVGSDENQMLDGAQVVSDQMQFGPSEDQRQRQRKDDDDLDVSLADKGGKSRHRNFVNFLATDKVPDSIFGIPVVQDESQYTEKDIEFFRKNPKAAGFYDLGDEEVDEDVPQQAAKSKSSRGAYPGSLNNPGNVEKRTTRRQGEVDSPHERWAKFATPQDGLREMADAIRQIAAVKLAEKGQDFTIRNFAEVYAPRVNKKGKKENDTDKYIRNLSADTGFDADEELARWDRDDMARFLRSVVKFESGAKHSAWFTDEEYAAAAAKLQEGAFE